MAASYATRSDLYGVGLSRGSLVNPRRPVAFVDAPNDRMVVDDHGLRTDHPISFYADPDATIPSPLVEGTTYYARPVDASTFEVAATVGGAKLDLVASETDSFGVIVSIEQDILDEIEFHSRWVDATLASQGAPFAAPYPRWVVGAVAKRAAASIVRRFGLAGYQRVLEEADIVTADVVNMGRKGIPLRDATATQPTALAVPSSASTRSTTRTIP